MKNQSPALLRVTAVVTVLSSLGRQMGLGTCSVPGQAGGSKIPDGDTSQGLADMAGNVWGMVQRQ
jgi:hypothetical protein